MIEHPDTVLPDDTRPGAYAALLAALATHEPEALARAAAFIEDEPRRGETAPPAAVLARSWLEFSGHLQSTIAPEGAKTYAFSYPATVAFDMVGSAGKEAADLRGREAIAAMLEVDHPLCAVQGPFPGHPTVLNLEVWLGSTTKKPDELDLEGRK